MNPIELIVTHRCDACDGDGSIQLLTSNKRCRQCSGLGVTVKYHPAGSTPSNIGYWDALRVTSRFKLKEDDNEFIRTD
jgi:DnaJ-class molecular chaperone